DAHAAAAEQASFLQQYDSLTHLPNRLLLRDRVEHALALARNQRTAIALLFLDLDRFEQVNDSLGLEAGDALVNAAAERIKAHCPASSTVSRHGGNAFIVLLATVDDADSVAAIAMKLCQAFVEPFAINGYDVGMALSVGVSMFPDDGSGFDALVQGANAAMHQAKQAGRNTYRFFTPAMNDHALDHLQLTGNLTNALRHDEFVLHYQPQVDLRSGRLVGAEALIRWQHPVEGLIPPGRFIALAEQSGHIVPIGAWALQTACRQARQWL
ncbi:diguanylate cyclase, partial [Duganella sp. FT3S]